MKYVPAVVLCGRWLELKLSSQFLVLDWRIGNKEQKCAKLSQLNVSQSLVLIDIRSNNSCLPSDLLHFPYLT